VLDSGRVGGVRFVKEMWGEADGLFDGQHISWDAA
jgi:hypothetical protein